MLVGCGEGKDSAAKADHSSLNSASAYDSSSSDDSSSSAGSRGSSSTPSTGLFADDMRSLMPNLEVDEQGLTDVGEGICVWYDDGVSYPEAIDSMEFMGANEALGATVIASAVDHLCPLAWPAQHRNASKSSSSSSTSGTSAQSPASQPVEPEPVTKSLCLSRCSRTCRRLRRRSPSPTRRARRRRISRSPPR